MVEYIRFKSYMERKEISIFTRKEMQIIIRKLDITLYKCSSSCKENNLFPT